ncbi:MAG: hypothetical protein FJY79_00805 [Candidatus Aminicenantes bacterium]|nr:hypothetical protein [Candidatus Aminicenantes bacterium]
MKKLIVAVLAGLVLLSAVLFFPPSVAAEEVGGCFQEHVTCREHALNLDAPWYQVTLFLTLCDLALAKCILHLSI